MVPPTRRRLLQAATAVTAGLAGCSALSGEESTATRTVSEDDGPRPPNGGSESDPDTVLVRADTRYPPVRIPDGDGEPTDPARLERFHPRLKHEIVDSASRAEKLTVADGVDAEPVSSFVSATDFDSETLYLESSTVEACFRLQLCSISWSTDEIRTDYAQQVRPYDDRCAADEYVFESRLVRIPAALDRDEVNSYGSSVGGSGRCDRDGPGGAEGTADSGQAVDTVTAAVDGGAE
ncbi:hypothetical protein [Natronomonas marina]|jgi:hypothetical protein|uniref:hypothetical protein n=1 Tax=Natronomonas marina TaxID=2961939 RepID=UPI0020C9772F|nr:hypothetical protein [Natronomonas marina]